MRIGEAREILIAEEAEKLVDQQNLAREAIDRVEQSGIVFLDVGQDTDPPADGRSAVRTRACGWRWT